jgi:predicted small secreted protein
MKKNVLIGTVLAAMFLAACSGNKTEGMIDDVDSTAVDSSASESKNPEVEKNDYKHPATADKANATLKAQEGQSVEVKSQTTDPNYKSSVKSGEKVSETGTVTNENLNQETDKSKAEYKKQF